RKAVALEEVAQQLREQLRLAQLAGDDDPRFEVQARDLHQLRGAVVREARGGNLRGADLQADEPLVLLREDATGLVALDAARPRFEVRQRERLLLRRLGRVGALCGGPALADRNLLAPERALGVAARRLLSARYRRLRRLLLPAELLLPERNLLRPVDGR